MEKFIVSARKYRPADFTSLIGQDSIARTLKNSIKRGQLAHAYLFCGPRGVGKTSTARIFAKTINCMNPSPDLEPCGECESCRSFTEGISYCIHELDAASNNSVEDIRALIEKVRIPPQVGKYSVYIIDEVHMLSAAAFNAFLKTLEEPPAYAIFILATTEKHKIIPTVLSRCQTYDFNRITVSDIVKQLTEIASKEGVTADPDALHVIAKKADGAMRDALTLFDQAVAFCGNNIDYNSVIKNLNVLDSDYYFNITNCFLSGNHSGALLIFDEILSKGFNALYFIGGLSSHLRNLLVCKDNISMKLLDTSPALIERYKEQSLKCSFNLLYKLLGETVKCESEYRLSSNQRLLVEFMLVKECSLSEELSSSLQSATPQMHRSSQQNILSTVQPQLQIAREQTQTEQQQAQAEQPQPKIAQEQTQTKQQQVQAEQPQPKIAQEQTQTEQQQAQQPAEVNSEIDTIATGQLSIKNLIRNAKGAHKEETKKITDNKEVTIEALNHAWEKMGKSQKAHPRLGTAISQTTPKLMEDNLTIIFTVSNSAQQAWIEKNSQIALTDFLKQELSNNNIKLIIKVKKAEESENKLYMPQQQAEFLMNNNEELRELKKDLDLELQ